MKTSELTGAALDWAVALIEFPDPYYKHDDRLVYVNGDDEFHYTPSTNWAQGGPIIERECIWLTHNTFSKKRGAHKGDDVWFQKGPTPLIAAMRCYVASKLGGNIDIPEGLK